MNSHPTRLGDYMTSRRKKGEDGLPTLSVTLNDGLGSVDNRDSHLVCFLIQASKMEV